MKTASAALKLAAGFGLLIVGGVLALPGIPGPGILIMLAGLFLLSDHFVWARKALAWVRQTVARFRQKERKGQRN